MHLPFPSTRLALPSHDDLLTLAAERLWEHGQPGYEAADGSGAIGPAVPFAALSPDEQAEWRENAQAVLDVVGEAWLIPALLGSLRRRKITESTIALEAVFVAIIGQVPAGWQGGKEVRHAG